MKVFLSWSFAVDLARLYHGQAEMLGMSRPMLNFGAVHYLGSDYATFAG